MKRYSGSWLGESPHIVVLGSRKLGNFIATLPLLHSLRRKYPAAKIDFWGSEVTKDFEEELVSNSPKAKRPIDWRMSLDCDTISQELSDYIRTKGRPTLLINCDGFNPVTAVIAGLLSPEWVVGNAMTKDLKGVVETGEHTYNKILDDKEWDSEKFLVKYEGHFKTQYIGELFCRMAFLDSIEDQINNIGLPTRHPLFKVPDILIHCTSTRSAKLWGKDNWCLLLDWCRDHKLSVGLVGAKPQLQKDEYNSDGCEDSLVDLYGKGENKTLFDLRGETNLIELAGACKEARAVITVDAGPLHVAVAVGTPVLAVVGNDKEGIGASPIRLWMPQKRNLFRTISDFHCRECMDNKYKNNGCLLDEHFCMKGVSSEQVIKWLRGVIE